MLTTVTVNTELDELNAPDMSSITALLQNPGGQGISLREAITAANFDPGEDEILLICRAAKQRYS